MKQKTKSKQGITLIALVVTIVVLLILAGVTITVLFGENGMLKTAQNSSLQTKLAELEEKANIAYADFNTKKYAEGNPSKVITMEHIKKELENQRYIIKQVMLDENSITEIELEPENIKMNIGKTATLHVNLKSSGETLEYYVEIEGKFYQINIKNNHIVVDKVNGKTQEELEKDDSPDKIEVSVDNNIIEILGKTEDTIEIKAGESVGKSQITVTYGKLAPKTCNVTVGVQPIEGSTNIENDITTTYGRIDILWLDEHNTIIQNPNKPILKSEENGTIEAKTKMRAIKWIEKDGKLAESPADEANLNNDWYHYKEKDVEGSDFADNNSSHWANAKTENGSFFVWIPRYAYRITYYADETSTKPTGYYDGNGMWSAENGQKRYDLEEGIEIVEDSEGNKYIVHPAFGTTKTDEASKTQNIELGGWDKPLKGFWFAKFEMSGEDGASLKSTPSTQSQKIKTIGNYYTFSRTACYGQTGKIDESDKNESFMYSHMCKNSEWGAVAYLAHSKYGRNGHEISANKHDSYTGGGINTSSYITEKSQKQSTTGNVYGIYDMSGGTSELMAIFNSVETVDVHNGTPFASTGGSSSKYATAYVGRKDANSPLSLCGKTGDATKEVSFQINIDVNYYGKRWFEDLSWGFERGKAFIARGYNYGDTEALIGIFASEAKSGWPGSYQAFRTVLCP